MHEIKIDGNDAKDKTAEENGEIEYTGPTVDFIKKDFDNSYDH